MVLLLRLTLLPLFDSDHVSVEGSECFKCRPRRMQYVCRASQPPQPDRGRRNFGTALEMADRRVRTGLLRRDRLRTAVGTDAHVSKKPFRHLDRRRAGAAQRPALDLDGDRGGANLLDGTIAGDLVAD